MEQNEELEEVFDIRSKGKRYGKKTSNTVRYLETDEYKRPNLIVKKILHQDEPRFDDNLAYDVTYSVNKAKRWELIGDLQNQSKRQEQNLHTENPEERRVLTSLEDPSHFKQSRAKRDQIFHETNEREKQVDAPVYVTNRKGKGVKEKRSPGKKVNSQEVPRKQQIDDEYCLEYERHPHREHQKKEERYLKKMKDTNHGLGDIELRIK